MARVRQSRDAEASTSRGRPVQQAERILSRQPADAGGWSYQAQNILARARPKSECVHDYFFKSGLDKGTIIEDYRKEEIIMARCYYLDYESNGNLKLLPHYEREDSEQIHSDYF